MGEGTCHIVKMAAVEYSIAAMDAQVTGVSVLLASVGKDGGLFSASLTASTSSRIHAIAREFSCQPKLPIPSL